MAGRPSLEEIFSDKAVVNAPTEQATVQETQAVPVDGRPSLDEIFSSAPVEKKNIWESPAPEVSGTDLLTRAKLSFAGTPDDKVRVLKEQFKFVEPQQDGNFLVGNDPRQMLPVNPEGVMNDFLGTIADNVNLVPSIAGQIAAGVATGGASVPVQIAAAGIGGGAGSLLGKLGSKAAGINTQKAEELAVDVTLDTMFSGAGQGLSEGLKGAAKVMLPKAGKLFDKVINNSENKAKSKDLIASTVHMATGIDKTDFLEASDIGFDKIFTKENLDPKSILQISKGAIDDINNAKLVAGQQVAQADEMLKKAVSPKYKIDQTDAYSYMRQELNNQGMIDGSGIINKNSMLSKDINFFRKLNNELGGSEKKVVVEAVDSNGKTYKQSLIQLVPPTEKISIEKAMQLRKSARAKYNEINPDLQYIAKVALSGGEDTLTNTSIKGLQGSIREVAEKAGVKEFAVAYDRFSGINKTLNALKQAGFDTSNPVSVENFLATVRQKPEISKQLIDALSKDIGSKFFEKARDYNLAQAFTQANSNYFRLGAVAGTVGASVGGGGIINRLARGAVIGGLSNPGIIRKLLTTSEKLGRKTAKTGVISQSIKNANKMTGYTDGTVLGQLLKSKFSEQKDSKEK